MRRGVRSHPFIHLVPNDVFPNRKFDGGRGRVAARRIRLFSVDRVWIVVIRNLTIAPSHRNSLLFPYASNRCNVELNTQAISWLHLATCRCCCRQLPACLPACLPVRRASLAATKPAHNEPFTANASALNRCVRLAFSCRTRPYFTSEPPCTSVYVLRLR